MASHGADDGRIFRTRRAPPRAVGTVAERAGFEPAVPVPRNTRSPGAPVQPLRHLSYGPSPRRARQGILSTRSAQPGGEGGIRTRDTRNGYTGFRDRRFQPLSHLSGLKIVSKAKMGLPVTPVPSRGSKRPVRAALRVDTFKTPYLALCGSTACPKRHSYLFKLHETARVPPLRIT